MFNINKWVCGLDFRRLPAPVFDPPQRALSGEKEGGGGGGGRLSILMSFVFVF